MSATVRTRYAPSPTGPQHIGGIRTALYAYLFAKKHGGSLVLRIEDTDQKRFVEGAEQYIIDSLLWAGIEYDEGVGKGGDYGPYRQSERNDLYAPFVQELLNSGAAYMAFDTPEELASEREKAKLQGLSSWQYSAVTRSYMKNSISLSDDEIKERLAAGEPFVVRLKVPRNEEIKFEDAIRGWVQFNSSQLDDKVLWKADKSPTYHLANVIDDHLMKITHVIRGEEWLPSAPTHVLLYKAFGWESSMPTFAHLPLLLKPDGNGKLSKRDGDRLGFPVYSMNWNDPETGELFSGFKEKGFFPAAFLNILAFLGWNPGTAQEIFSKEELIEAFDLGRVSKSGAKFDFEKAKWYNQHYLRAASNAELVELISPKLTELSIEKDAAYLEKFCDLMKERAVFADDLVEQGLFLLKDKFEFDLKAIKKKWRSENKKPFMNLAELLEASESFEADVLETIVKTWMAAHDFGFGVALPPLRLALTGTMQGPSVFSIMELLGQEKSITRLREHFEYFDSVVTTKEEENVKN